MWRRSGAAALALLAGGLLVRPATGATQTRRLGVVSFYNPRLMYLKYQPLVDYLSEHTSDRWEAVLSSSYQRTVDELCAGHLDVAYLGPFTYARAHAACAAVPVVQLRTHGKATYQGLILVRTDAPFHSLTELAGKRFGFGARLSTSSHLVAREMLERAGLHPGQNVSCTYFGHHERAARAVLLREVDACCVRDIVGEKFLQRGLRLLARSDPIPNFPLVVGRRGLGALAGQLVHALVELPARDPAVRALIAGWDDELAAGFGVCGDADFEVVRRQAMQVFGPLALTLPETALECGGGGR